MKIYVIIVSKKGSKQNMLENVPKGMQFRRERGINMKQLFEYANQYVQYNIKRKSLNGHEIAG